MSAGRPSLPAAAHAHPWPCVRASPRPSLSIQALSLGSAPADSAPLLFFCIITVSSMLHNPPVLSAHPPNPPHTHMVRIPMPLPPPLPPPHPSIRVFKNDSSGAFPPQNNAPNTSLCGAVLALSHPSPPHTPFSVLKRQQDGLHSEMYEIEKSVYLASDANLWDLDRCPSHFTSKKCDSVTFPAAEPRLWKSAGELCQHYHEATRDTKWQGLGGIVCGRPYRVSESVPEHRYGALLSHGPPVQSEHCCSGFGGCF